MRRRVILCLLWLAVGLSANGQTTNRWPVVRYTLLDGSYLVDDCPVCGRPTILQPLRGTFDLVLLQDTAPFTRYEIRSIEFTASPGFAGEVRLTGGGNYERFEEFAILQSMDLAVQIKDSFTNRMAFFTNDSRVVEKPFPLIQISLTQTNGTLLQVYSLNLLAAPLREVWFSTTRVMTSTNRASPTNVIGAGDLISNRGRVVKRNTELTARLGFMPIVADLGMDAVHVTRRGEILFSLPQDVFSERLGPIRHGDLVSNLGTIVRRNQSLLAAFGVPMSQPDAGLDALQVMPDGEVLFSIRSNVTDNVALPLSHGDVLSDRGRVFRTHASLLANFQPTVTNHNFGLDALHVFASGEIWFSVGEGFTDTRLGKVLPGDLLSDRGYRVFSNQELVAAFAPSDPTQDFGLDALYVVTDTKPASPPPRILNLSRNRAGGPFRVEWDGEGEVFQLEHAPGPLGPWHPCSELLPDLLFDDACDLTSNDSGFYRLRQW